MKISVCKRHDLEYEVIDVLLRIEEDGAVRSVWIKGFDEDEWIQVDPYAEKLATVLNIEYIGEIYEEGDEQDYD